MLMGSATSPKLTEATPRASRPCYRHLFGARHPERADRPGEPPHPPHRPGTRRGAADHVRGQAGRRACPKAIPTPSSACTTASLRQHARRHRHGGAGGAGPQSTGSRSPRTVSTLQQGDARTCTTTPSTSTPNSASRPTGGHALYLGSRTRRPRSPTSSASVTHRSYPLDWGVSADRKTEDLSRLQEAGHTLRGKDKAREGLIALHPGEQSSPRRSPYGTYHVRPYGLHQRQAPDWLFLPFRPSPAIENVQRHPFLTSARRRTSGVIAGFLTGATNGPWCRRTWWTAPASPTRPVTWNWKPSPSRTIPSVPLPLRRPPRSRPHDPPSASTAPSRPCSRRPSSPRGSTPAAREGGRRGGLSANAVERNAPARRNWKTGAGSWKRSPDRVPEGHWRLSLAPAEIVDEAPARCPQPSPPSASTPTTRSGITRPTTS